MHERRVAIRITPSAFRSDKRRIEPHQVEPAAAAPMRLDACPLPVAPLATGCAVPGVPCWVADPASVGDTESSTASRLHGHRLVRAVRKLSSGVTDDTYQYLKLRECVTTHVLMYGGAFIHVNNVDITELKFELTEAGTL